MRAAAVMTTLLLLLVVVGSDVQRVACVRVRPGLREYRDGTHPDPTRWLRARAATLLLGLLAAALMLPVLWGLLT